ncbi:hypothetical protein DERP_002004 [Dermatophagoides pteronyssinus]|uniref:Uncharacterized protein n=1 Tax=Dermatophagoides pteronyssinus TaxID=6956 RepID=A0ABQ8JGH7_DERPT|nr:hypothetical protein DERP_002004 [Dermatophagoides pteronyssinus]
MSFTELHDANNNNDDDDIDKASLKAREYLSFEIFNPDVSIYFCLARLSLLSLTSLLCNRKCNIEHVVLQRQKKDTQIIDYNQHFNHYQITPFIRNN